MSVALAAWREKLRTWFCAGRGGVLSDLLSAWCTCTQEMHTLMPHIWVMPDWIGDSRVLARMWWHCCRRWQLSDRTQVEETASLVHWHIFRRRPRVNNCIWCCGPPDMRVLQCRRLAPAKIHAWICDDLHPLVRQSGCAAPFFFQPFSMFQNKSYLAKLSHILDASTLPWRLQLHLFSTCWKVALSSQRPLYFALKGLLLWSTHGSLALPNVSATSFGLATSKAALMFMIPNAPPTAVSSSFGGGWNCQLLPRAAGSTYRLLFPIVGFFCLQVAYDFDVTAIAVLLQFLFPYCPVFLCSCPLRWEATELPPSPVRLCAEVQEK